MESRVNIAIIESSLILRNGLVSVLQRAVNLNVNIAVITHASESAIMDEVSELSPNIIIIGAMHYGLLSRLIKCLPNSKIIALQSSLVDVIITKEYDEAITIYDSAETILSTLHRVIESIEQGEVRTELSLREKEIVVCIAKGMSNKEIAEELNLSTHTVVSHRRNITTKLDIYSASGLTIYAIINKLVELDSIPAK